MSVSRPISLSRAFRALGPAVVVAFGLIAPGALAQQAPPPTSEEDVRAFCGNIADAARDQRYLLQKQELEELQAGVDERLKKREEFMRVAESQLVDIYKNMKSDAAAQQLEIVRPEIAAAIIMKLSPRLASAILNEMDSTKAAGLTGIIASAAAPDQPEDPS